MKKSWIFGILAVVCQSLSIAIVLWLIKANLGIELLGLWSLILTTLSIASIAQFGLGPSMIHFAQVAMKNERETGELGQLRKYYDTAIQFTFILFVLIIILLVYPIRALILGVSGPEFTSVLDGILPIVSISLILGILSRIPEATLNGLGRFWLAQLGLISGAAIYLTVAFLTVDQFGLRGAAWAHLAMTTTQLLVAHSGVVIFGGTSKGIIQRVLIGSGKFKVIREMFRLGMSIQFMSALLFLIEPLARVSIGYAGGIGMVGYYEMASRIALAARDLFVRPMAHLAGHFSALQQASPKLIKPAFIEAFNRSILLAIICSFIVAASAIWLADYWVQERETFFFYTLFFLVVGWSYSMLAMCGYYYGLGTGQNRNNLVGVCIFALIAATGSTISIFAENPYLVPIGMAVGVIAGHSYIAISYSRVLGINLLSTAKIYLLKNLAVGISSILVILPVTYLISEHWDILGTFVLIGATTVPILLFLLRGELWN